MLPSSAAGQQGVDAPGSQAVPAAQPSTAVATDSTPGTAPGVAPGSDVPILPGGDVTPEATMAAQPAAPPPPPAEHVFVDQARTSQKAGPKEQHARPDLLEEHVQLELRSAPDVTFFATPATSERPQRLCAGECRLRVQPGQYRIALGVPGRNAVQAGIATVDVDGVLEGTYRSRAPARATLGALSALGVSMGVGFLARGAHEFHDVHDACTGGTGSCDTSDARARVGAGLVGAVVGVALGLAALLLDDEATVRARPANLVLTWDGKARSDDPQPMSVAQRDRLLLSQLSTSLSHCATFQELKSLRISVGADGSVQRVLMTGETSHRACVLEVLGPVRFAEGHMRELAL